MFLVMTFGQLARQTRFYGTIFRQSFLLFFLLWPASFQNLEEQHWRNGDPTVTWEKCWDHCPWARHSDSHLGRSAERSSHVVGAAWSKIRESGGQRAAVATPSRCLWTILNPSGVQGKGQERKHLKVHAPTWRLPWLKVRAQCFRTYSRRWVPMSPVPNQKVQA